MDSTEKKTATAVHKGFFDKSRMAIDSGYYLEAVMYEYSAIEGRLEVICGLLGCPCNKELDANTRNKINISSRISCLKTLYKNHPACICSNTRIDNKYWEKLNKWRKARNIYVHGLYKRPELFVSRMEDAKALATEGIEIARILYNEAKRIRRLQKSHPEMLNYDEKRCKGDRCF